MKKKLYNNYSFIGDILMDNDEILNLYVFNDPNCKLPKNLGLFVISTWATLITIVVTLSVL